MPAVPKRLSDYPHVRVRIRCESCRRFGDYNLARLAERFGAEVELGDLLVHLTASCRWQHVPGTRLPRKYEARCLAGYVNLTGSDGPAAPGLRLVKG